MDLPKAPAPYALKAPHRQRDLSSKEEPCDISKFIPPDAWCGHCRHGAGRTRLRSTRDDFRCVARRFPLAHSERGQLAQPLAMRSSVVVSQAKGSTPFIFAGLQKRCYDSRFNK